MFSSDATFNFLIPCPWLSSDSSKGGTAFGAEMKTAMKIQNELMHPNLEQIKKKNVTDVSKFRVDLDLPSWM